ncbi:hypothetical protein JTB14_034136 [Gonioctena quinquepunctata]|nr:hypothetical protein JTB14_034136 [Gonioctena quinquepunctata]
MVPKCISCEEKFIENQPRSFHRFPEEPRRTQWSSFLGLEGVDTIGKFVCSDHFTEEDFITKPGGKRYLKFGALPIIHQKPPVRTPPKITFDLPQFGAILPEESVEPAWKRYPNRHPPDYRVIQRVQISIPETDIGGMSDGRPTMDVDKGVLAEVDTDFSNSVRNIGRRTSTAESTVYVNLQRYQLYPYHVHSLCTEDMT